MRDSYEQFFDKMNINKKNFFNFGLQEIIYADINKANDSWGKLKNDIKKNQPVYIRGFGRNGNGSKMYIHFYNTILKNENITIDKTNNQEPTKIVEKITGYSKRNRTQYEYIQNYQISHIFGKTKNVYAFTAPWNIVYMPKIFDPFTGHEAKGGMVDEFTKLFKEESYSRFKPLIEDYNQLMSDESFKQSIESYLKDISNNEHYTPADVDKFIKSVQEELSPISL